MKMPLETGAILMNTTISAMYLVEKSASQKYMHHNHKETITMRTLTTAQNAMLALLASAQKEGPKVSVSETSVEDYRNIPNSVHLTQHLVPFKSQEKMFRQVAKDVMIPVIPTHIAYCTVLFKSQEEGHHGEPTEGCNVEILGYDAERNADETPAFDDQGQLIPITMDENGNELKPQVLMFFRPNYGLRYGAGNRNLINFVPGGGVPKKEIETKKGETREVADFSLIPDIETSMQRPLDNAFMEGNQALLEFIEKIPRASNAPVQNKKPTGKLISTSGGGSRIGGIFGRPPEEAKAEATEAEATTEKKKPASRKA